jgi:hypothetical protein
VRLPSGASLQQVYLDDAVVQARDEEGMLSVLIPKNKTSTVKVDYEIQAEPISSWGDVNILLPHSDIKVKYVSWYVFYESNYLLNSSHGEAQLTSYNIQGSNARNFGSLGHYLKLSYDVLSPKGAQPKHTLSFRPQLPDLFEPLLFTGLLFICLLIGVVLARFNRARLFVLLIALASDMAMLMYAGWIKFNDSVGVLIFIIFASYIMTLIFSSLRNKSKQVKQRGPLVSYPTVPYVPKTDQTERDQTERDQTERDQTERDQTESVHAGNQSSDDQVPDDQVSDDQVSDEA